MVCEWVRWWCFGHKREGGEAHSTQNGVEAGPIEVEGDKEATRISFSISREG